MILKWIKKCFNIINRLEKVFGSWVGILYFYREGDWLIDLNVN